MTKNEFEALTVKEIKTLLETTQFEFDVLLWAQEDSRSSVRKLAAAYVMRQKKQLAEFQRLNALYTYENSFYEEGIFEVAGVDEVGRGPIAGPVTVAAVILPPNAQIEGLNDSKKIAPHKRELIYDEIMRQAVAVSCISYGPEKIDELNIYRATQTAMYEAINTLKVPAKAVLVDAMPLPELAVPVESLVKGDSKSASIAAASIVAKVTRAILRRSIKKPWNCKA